MDRWTEWEDVILESIQKELRRLIAFGSGESISWNEEKGVFYGYGFFVPLEDFLQNVRRELPRKMRISVRPLLEQLGKEIQQEKSSLIQDKFDRITFMKSIPGFHALEKK